MSFVDSYNKFHPSDDPISGELKDSVDDKYNLELKDWQRQDDRAFLWVSMNKKKHHQDCQGLKGAMSRPEDLVEMEQKVIGVRQNNEVKLEQGTVWVFHQENLS